MEKKFLNLVSKLEEKDNAITTFMLSAEQFAEVKRKEMEQGSEKQGVQAVDVAMERSNDQDQGANNNYTNNLVQTSPSVSSSTAIAPLSLLPYTNNFHNNNLAFHVKPVPERRIVTITVSTISGETCYEAGDNMMNYSTGNKTTTLININDVPHNVGEGFLYARTSRQTITTTTTVTPHMSKARQVLGDNRDSKVSINRKEYNHQQASKYCSS